MFYLRVAQVAITIYGVLMAYLSGILKRVIALFKGGLVRLEIEI